MAGIQTMSNSCEPDYYKAFEALIAGDPRLMQAYFQTRLQRQQRDFLNQTQLMEQEVQLLHSRTSN